MYHGKRLKKQDASSRHTRNRMSAVLVSVVLLLGVTVGGTLAWLATHTGPVENTFTPSTVGSEVTEEFDGAKKSNVNVKNTGDTDAFVRVRLVTYRVNDAGQPIGGTAAIPAFTPGDGWVEKDGYYYYKHPVAANGSPAVDLIGNDGIELTGSYSDADGGKQVIEVLAEAIQAGPEEAVKEAWGSGFSIDVNGDLVVPGTNG